MDETTIRQRLRAAFGESTYPPDLSSRVGARLGAPAVEQQGSSWVLAVAAILLTIALVATIVFGAREFRPRATVPVQPPPSHAPSTNACPSFGQLNPTVSSVKMSSPSTGWALGGLRTTDGGAHWKDTSPAAIREGLPAHAIASGLDGFKDFYLDANHAWEFRTFASSTSCTDHAEVFSTSDGGRSWKASKALSFGLPAGWSVSVLDFQFVDAHQGWLWTEAGSLGQTAGFGSVPVTQEAELYGTVDGGITWRLVSRLKPSNLGFASSTDCPFPLGEVTFASSTSGWMAINCQTSLPELLDSSDGGVTWTLARLPNPATSTNCPCLTQLPRFFDATHGMVEVDGNYADYNPLTPTPLRLLATSDGGLTWQAVPAAPTTGFTLALDFVDSTNWWAVLTEPGWQKGQPTNDWLYRTTDGGQTWTLVQKDLPMGYPPPDLVFSDSLHGLAVQDQNATGGLPTGPGIEVLTTSDGGHTWKSMIAQVIVP